MENYVVSLERFYGPLDLLLYLVEKDEMDIYDISLSAISDQYLAYLQAAREEEIEVEKMTAFLKMATFLLQLKSRSLLPSRSDLVNSETDETDPEAELIARIVLYRQFKTLAGFLDARQKDLVERSFDRPFAELPEVAEAPYRGSKENLAAAYLKALEREQTYRRFTLPFRDIRVEDKMQELWEKLTTGGKKALTFAESVREAGEKREITAMFLALLELLREQKITVTQKGLFDEIWIQARA